MFHRILNFRRVNDEKSNAEKAVRDIRRKTWKKYSAEDKIHIVIDSLRGDDSISAFCRKEGINANLYYRWSNGFMEAGKKRLAGDEVREDTTDEVKELRAEPLALKETLAETLLENRLLKKSMVGDFGNGTIHEVLCLRKVRADSTGTKI